MKTEVKAKKTKLSDVYKVIHKWSKDNDGQFFGDFSQFTKDGEVSNDSKLICFGDRKTLSIAIKEFNRFFKEDKNEFINW